MYLIVLVVHVSIQKSSENLIFANGNKSCKSRSSVTKVEFDLW